MARKQHSFLLAALFLVAAVILLFPCCRYYVDPDATAYLTIARRYAAGDLPHAVNGYWSPLSCWLTATGIRAGFEPFTAAIMVNTAGALGFLWISNSFFRKFAVRNTLLPWLNLILLVFLSAAVYVQSFADLWQCFLLLGTFRLMCSGRFARSPGLWVLYGITGALAYFAKAYSFPFFMLNTVCCGYLALDGAHAAGRRAWLRMCGVSLTIFLACCTPWLLLLHEHYGFWTTSTAGRLNRSWYLTGHPFYREGISYFLPPAYPDSPYYWEDPYLSNGATPQFWSAPALFFRQILKAGHNLLKLNVSLMHFSACALAVWLLAALILMSRRIRSLFPDGMRTVSLSLLLFPAAFVLINFEPRYIWYTYPLTLLIAAAALPQLLDRIEKRALRVLVLAVFTGSFLAGPVSDLSGIAGTGRTEYLLGQRLQAIQIRGSFASDASDPEEERAMIRLAYFSGNPYYLAPVKKQMTSEELLKELRKNRIHYYFSLRRDGALPAAPLLLEDGSACPYRQEGNLTIYLLNPENR